jgi:hypothetical protein
MRTDAGVGVGADEAQQVFVMSGTIAIEDGAWKDFLGLRWLELQQPQQDGETKTGDSGELSVSLESTDADLNLRVRAVTLSSGGRMTLTYDPLTRRGTQNPKP